MKILSVDDKAENLYMLEALLRGHGHEVDSASNGLDALRLAERGNYDLVISDILMPRMDGFQLCRELKKDPRLRRIPFIFYTATYTDPKDASFALSLGADRFLIKPVEPETFLRAIEEVMTRRREQQAPAPLPDVPEDESIYLKEYNARLVAKLEKKMLDLEQANRALMADIAERERTEAERAKLERQLRQAQKMEAIGTLAGGIAHDFNNILAGIMGFAELADHDAGDAALARSHIAEILRAGQRARELVRQILAFSRQQEQARTPLRLDDCIDEVLRLLRATIPASVEIERHLEAGTPAVLADPTQIHQVVTNLLTNAWHAIGEGPGRISLGLASISVDEDFARTHPDLRPGRYVRMQVQDSGCGMDAKTLERVFEPFFTTKEPGTGTGLGLAVVHGIMKASDGAIAVYSEPERGTTFHLYFPAVDLDPVVPASEKPPFATGKGQRILFIDDEPALATLGERFLKRLGYQPVVERDPSAAIDRFEKEDFAAVITDLTMPQLSGLEVGRRLLHLRPELPIVLTTGYSATLDASRARSLGFRELLLKPYNIESLGSALRKVLENSQ
jgi:signal transduction histidine kinase